MKQLIHHIVFGSILLLLGCADSTRVCGYKLPSRAVLSVSGAVGGRNYSGSYISHLTIDGGDHWPGEERSDIWLTPGAQEVVVHLAGNGTEHVGDARLSFDAAPGGRYEIIAMAESAGIVCQIRSGDQVLAKRIVSGLPTTLPTP